MDTTTEFATLENNHRQVFSYFGDMSFFSIFNYLFL